MMLIGGGARGLDGTTDTGGGSGAVTVWYGAAQHVPNSLLVRAPTRNGTSSTFCDTTVSIWTTANTAYDLLTAASAIDITGGVAMTANQFTASGFFQSVAGQNGFAIASSPSATTFLSGGSDTVTTVSNYGYSGGSTSAGYFMLQPIPVGTGGNAGNSNSANGGLGCGSYRASGSGGEGMVLIASW